MRQVPIEEAAKILGVSPKTVERRLKPDHPRPLKGTKDEKGRWLVEVPDEVVGEQAGADRQSETGRTKEELERENAALRDEVMWLRGHVSQLVEGQKIVLDQLDRVLRQPRGFFRLPSGSGDPETGAFLQEDTSVEEQGSAVEVRKGWPPSWWPFGQRR